MNRYTVAVLVRNQFGVLNRVTSMFRRRQFNIIALSVSETESVEYSRITVTFEGEENNKQQLINQLYNASRRIFHKGIQQRKFCELRAFTYQNAERSRLPRRNSHGGRGLQRKDGGLFERFDCISADGYKQPD